MAKVCDVFVNLPPNSYRPLVCKPLTVQTRTIGGTGRENKANYFFLMKPNTIREYATLDLLYPTPNFIKFALQQTSTIFARATTQGPYRVTTDGFLRVTS